MNNILTQHRLVTRFLIMQTGPKLWPFLFGTFLFFGGAAGGAEPPGDAATPRWTDARNERLPGGLSISLSEPVLVARSKGYLWFPTLAKLDDGRLLAVMSSHPDAHTATPTCLTAWSTNGGLTWSPPKTATYGYTKLTLPTGDLLLLPYYLYPVKDGLGAPYQTVAEGERNLRVVKDGVHVTGWPRPVGSLDPALGLGGFVFNGQSVLLKNGSYLATLYGWFERDKLYSLVAAESKDGVRWAVKSVIADTASCGFKGSGPSESAVCRLKDGRLMCVFRTDGGLPYGQTWSSDEGRTWEKAVRMDFGSVQPSLTVLDDGMVVLTGGRPGVFAWLNADGTGRGWHRIDVAANHSTIRPDDSICDTPLGEKPDRNTSSYTEVVSMGNGHLLVVYDRLPRGWKSIPPDSPDTNSVWVMRITVVR